MTRSSHLQQTVSREDAMLAALRQIAGLTKAEIAVREAKDKERYHPTDPAKYGSAVGMPYKGEDGQTYFACVGCWHCCGDGIDWRGHQGRARLLLRSFGEDY